jgi:hypothetical protein
VFIHLRRNAIAYVALIVAMGGTAYAANNVFVGANGKLRACAGKKSGSVRLLKNGKHCQKSERAVTWNARGPKGASGASGAPGSSGTQGPTGPAGVAATRYFGTVSDDGTAHTGTIGSSALNSPGRFNVAFDADLSACSAIVSPGSNASAGGTANPGTSWAAYVGQAWSTGSLTASTHSVAVEFYASVAEGTTGDHVNTAFHIAVLC